MTAMTAITMIIRLIDGTRQPPGILLTVLALALHEGRQKGMHDHLFPQLQDRGGDAARGEIGVGLVARAEIIGHDHLFDQAKESQEDLHAIRAPVARKMRRPVSSSPGCCTRGSSL